MATYKSDSQWAAANLVAFAMGGDPRPRLNAEGGPKLSPDGRPTFSTGVVVARPDGGQDRGVTISVTEPTRLPLGVLLRPDGNVWLTPYESNGRVGVSIVCDRLVPADKAPVSTPGGKA
jgi:hypothetical protein